MQLGLKVGTVHGATGLRDNEVRATLDGELQCMVRQGRPTIASYAIVSLQ